MKRYLWMKASTKKGNKPDFHRSAGGVAAKELYEYFYDCVKTSYQSDRVKDGVFQAMMDVSLVNDGPVSSHDQPRSQPRNVMFGISSHPVLRND